MIKKRKSFYSYGSFKPGFFKASVCAAQKVRLPNANHKNSRVPETRGKKAAQRAALVLALSAAAFVLAACSVFDDEARRAAASFEAVSKAADAAPGALYIEIQGGGFSVSPDFAGSNEDITIYFDAIPFIASGLDYGRLPKEFTFDWNRKRLKLAFDIGLKPLPPGSNKSITEAIKGIISIYRERISYRQEIDQYCVMLGNENILGWASDMAYNDKDIAFTLNPEPFIKAGLDPYRPEGWLYSKVAETDASGARTKVDKLVRAFNLE